MEANQPQGEHQPSITKSSRINILLMKRTNRLAIAMFVGGIIYFIVSRYVFGKNQ